MTHNKKIVLCVNLFTLFAFLLICIALYRAPLGLLDDQKQIIYTRELGFLQLFRLDSLYYFRPVKNLLFYLFMLDKPTTLVYARILSFIISFCAYLSVKKLLTKITKSALAGSIASSFWFLAPTMLSSIAWFSCTNLMVMTLTGSSAIYCYIKQKEKTKHKTLYFLLTCLLLFISLLCYEGGVALLPMIFAVDVFLFEDNLKERKVWIKYLYIVMIFLLYMTMRYIYSANHSAFSNKNFGPNITTLQICFSSAWFTMHHITMWLLPSNSQYLMGNYDWGSVPLYTIILCWITIALMTTFALVERKKNPLLSLGISWCLLGFLPMSNLFAFRNGPYGDYYLHYTSLGIALIIAYLIKKNQTLEKNKNIFYIFIGCYMAYIYSTTLSWLLAWQNPIFMIENTLCVFPKQVNILSKEVNYYLKMGDTTRAKSILSTMDATPEANCEATAHKLWLSGKTQEAFDFLEENAKKNPPPSQWSLYAMGYLQGECLNNDAKAIMFYKQTIDYNSYSRISMQAMNQLALTYERQGKITEAIKLWEKLLPITDNQQEVQRKIDAEKIYIKQKL